MVRSSPPSRTDPSGDVENLHSRPIDQAIWGLSRHQHGLVSVPQLRALGVSAKALQVRREDGRLTQILPGVYRIGGTPSTWKQGVTAATLSLAPHGLASHRLATQLWRLDGVSAAPTEVLVPRHRRLARQTFLVHESRDLRASDVDQVEGIPVTSPTRTLIDLGAVVHPYRLEQALDDAIRRRLVDLGQLAARLQQVARPGRRGVGPLRPLLEERMGQALSPTNTFENRARRLATSAGLPTPVCQHPVDLGDTTVYLDLAWPEVKLALECDGLAHHFAAHQLRWDDRRQNALVLLGWMVLRFTWADVTERADDARVLLRRAWLDRKSAQVRR